MKTIEVQGAFGQEMRGPVTILIQSGARNMMDEAGRAEFKRRAEQDAEALFEILEDNLPGLTGELLADKLFKAFHSGR